MGRLRRHVRLAREEGGYSLIELMAVMIILSTVLGGLTALFVSGTKTELELNRRFQAQQNARLALDKMRRELHCASAITPTTGVPVTSITVTLPAQCPSAGGVQTNVTYSTALVSGTRWKLKRGTATVADYLTNDDVFTYVTPSTSSLGRLHVDFPVNVYPSEGWKRWRLVDDIVLRNTLRQ